LIVTDNDGLSRRVCSVMTTADVCRKSLWSRDDVVSSSRDRYDRLSLQRVNVDAGATSSFFSATRPSPTAAEAPATAASPDMM